MPSSPSISVQPPPSIGQGDDRAPLACGQCGYDLTAIIDDLPMSPCPECGITAPPVCSGNELPWPIWPVLLLACTWPVIGLSLLQFMALFRPPKDAGFIGPATVFALRWTTIAVAVWWPWHYGAVLAWKHLPLHLHRSGKWTLRLAIYVASGIVLGSGLWLGTWVFINW